MSISSKFAPHDGFLYCEARGDYSFEDACLLLREVLAKSAQHGATTLLVDYLQMGGRPTAVERFALSEFLAREMVDHIIDLKSSPRLALLGKESLVDPNRFWELVAANRGVQMRTVKEMEEALNWLGDSAQAG